MASPIGRREFLATLGGAAATWPLAARAQQSAMPVVGFVSGRAPEASARNVGAFRKRLNETGYVKGQNVTVGYHWREGRYDRPPPGRHGVRAEILQAGDRCPERVKAAAVELI
jgi:hypothetical protein